MSKKRDTQGGRRRKLRDEVERSLLARVREQMNLAVDEQIPDAVLLAEVDGYMNPNARGRNSVYLLEAREFWFAFRLLGVANSDAQRRRLAFNLKQRYSGGFVWGLLGSAGPSRRTPAAGRRRNRARRCT